MIPTGPTIRRLDPSDDRSGFRSGIIELDRFFQRYAGQNQFRYYIGTTYIADVGGRIGGFVTVSSGELTAESLRAAVRKRLPAYPVPVLRIARLAVDERCRGLGLGKLLLRAMLELALELRDRGGCAGVVVDAKSTAVSFYERLGSTPLATLGGELGDRPAPQPMFLATQTISKAVGSSG